MKKVRHVLGLSGGKDSTALAVYMRDKEPEMEYFFSDTGAELPETYEYLEKLEAYLGKKIVRLNPGKTFEELLERKNGYLPSPKARWCTVTMKIIPFEQFVGDDDVISYIGIRADENRSGYISTKPNIKPVFPFKEAGIGIKEVHEILNRSGLGLPKYYEWRSRSGCYFCFFQRKKEWMGLLERHPDLYEKSKSFEKTVGDKKFTWVEGTTLAELEKQKDDILRRADKSRQREELVSKNLTLFEQFSQEYPEESDDSNGCTICEI
ncbi:MAG: phosphoadenosine phosphosulfate reductase family protein [Bdellovibrionaceae bacterium]|nr:phosphoadenosine phosphosulfate reductase family protein [Pseudobdellovibrionaceae bacterium]